MKKELMIFLVLSLLLVSGVLLLTRAVTAKKRKQIWKKWIFQTSPKT